MQTRPDNMRQDVNVKTIDMRINNEPRLRHSLTLECYAKIYQDRGHTSEFSYANAELLGYPAGRAFSQLGDLIR